MGKLFSILHISDLHRSSSDPISNDELISALIGDRDRYTQETPKITPPDAIVVSGDIIQGVPLGVKNYGAEIEDQYSVAERFLDELVNRFLSGDRSRIVIIPGNHDVDWNTSFKAMEKITKIDLHPKFISQLHSTDSPYRWDWKTFTPYQVIDSTLYAQRLDAFWRFFGRFYSGVNGLLRVQNNSDVNLFSFCDGRIGLAAYNSCCGNDCFAFHGMIPKDVVARSHLELKDLGVFDLLIGVWHHSIEGTPYRNDYMDKDTICGMIGRGFRLGLYGHQHKAQAIPYQIWLPDREGMVLVSAGSLCAGRSDLPFGVPRQYNILEIGQDFKSVRVHVREMSVSNLFSRGRFIELGAKSYIDLKWDSPKNSAGGLLNTTTARLRLIIEEAEEAAKSGNPTEALKLLENLDLPNGSYERKLFLYTATECQNWASIIKLTNPPTTIEELFQMVDAFIRLKDFYNANKNLEKFSVQLNLPDSIKLELQLRISTQKNIAQ